MSSVGSTKHGAWHLIQQLQKHQLLFYFLFIHSLIQQILKSVRGLAGFSTWEESQATSFALGVYIPRKELKTK